MLDYDNAALAVSLDVYRKKLTKAKEIEIKEAAEEARETKPFWLLLDAPKVCILPPLLTPSTLIDYNFRFRLSPISSNRFSAPSSSTVRLIRRALRRRSSTSLCPSTANESRLRSSRLMSVRTRI